MKKTAGITIVLLFVSSTGFGQLQNTEASNVVVRFFNGLSLRNTDTLRALTTPDFLLLEDGAIWNLDTLIQSMAPLQGRSFERNNRFEFLKAEADGNTAWVSYRNQADILLDGRSRTIRWLETAVLRYQNGSWKLHLLHSTRLK